MYKRQSLCASCKHFIHRRRNKNGGLKGMCELSSSDRMRWEAGEQTRPAHGRFTCARYEEGEQDL